MSALSAVQSLANVAVVQALVQAVLAALGPNQNQRLLRLHTPLGPNVLLAERMLGTETIGPRQPGLAPSAGFQFEVLALSTNAHLKLEDLIGQPVRLDLLTAQSFTALRPFHGYVTAFALLGSDGGLARYKLTIEPWLSFLAHREDAWVFQDKTVMEILDEVFTDYQAQGKLAPAWRWEVADASVYSRRSLCVQYHESDLAFVQRLMAEEGLFCWFEHESAEGDTLGQHTLVIADHNGCFKPNIQERVRFTQSASASFKEDSITRFDEMRHVVPTVLSAASWDHSIVSQAVAEAAGDANIAVESLDLVLRDQPGAYAYETVPQAERLVCRHLEAVQAPAYRCQGEGPMRQAACGTTFTLAEHPSVDPDDRWVILTVQHRARNNITADLSTSLQSLLGKMPEAFEAPAEDTADTSRATRPSLFKGPANQTTEPLYLARFFVQDASRPVRGTPCMNERGDLTFTRPQVTGTQTAIVVGLGEPVHTDRDGRIKIQFHWQRGAQSTLRLDAPTGSNAPGDDSTGTWVRVAQASAGANWGGHFTPRLGQEVLVSFVEDDIDRPVVVGSAYNGAGSAEAQGNQVGAGAGTATGNAAAWFPGNQNAGELQGHQHPQVLAGFKSQSLEASQSGTGDYNLIVFDDSPGEARAQLSSTVESSTLQVGHLLQQDDNQRLAKRGHGLDLNTTAYGAVRAGSGLLLTGSAKPQGTEAGAHAMDVRPEMSQLQQADELVQTLVQAAQKHEVKLDAEPAADKLPCRTGFDNSQCSLESTDSASATAANEIEPAAQASTQPVAVYDAQIRFVDVTSQPMARYVYILTLEDDSRTQGITDHDGKTVRVTTEKPIAIKQVEFTAKVGGVTPAGEELMESLNGHPVHELFDVVTSNKDVGTSVITQMLLPCERPMTPGEIKMARSVFQDSIDYSLVQIHMGSYNWQFNDGKKFQANADENEIYYPLPHYSEDFSLETDSQRKITFIHEMAHIWQYQMGYLGTFAAHSDGAEMYEKHGYEHDKPGEMPPAYRYNSEKPRPFKEYNREQQAELIARFYAVWELGDPQYHAQGAFLREVLKDFLENPHNKDLMPRTANMGE